MRVRALLPALLLASASPAWAGCEDLLPRADEVSAERRKVEAADLIELRDIGMPDPSFVTLPSPLAISPDGKSIAFVLNRADLASNGYCRGLVVLSVDGASPPRLIDRGGALIMARDVKRGLFVVTGFPDIVVPAWSPDGRWIAYLKRVDGVIQLWRARADGSGAMAVTRSPVDVERWAWARNGQDLIFASRPGIEAANRALDAEGRSGYLYDARVTPNAGPRPQIREADVPEKLFRITPDSGTVTPIDAADPDALAPEGPIVAVGRDGRKAGTEPETGAPLSPVRIWVTDRGRKRPCPAASCREGIVNLWWDDDGTLVFQRREGWAKGRMALYRWKVGKAPPKRILASDDWLLGCVHRAGRLFCTAEHASAPRRLVAVDLSSGRTTTLFEPNPGFARLDLGTVERLTWRNHIGLPAWGDLVLPPGHVASDKLPLVIVQYHSDGFLRGGTGDDHPIFLLAARGFAVLSIERPAIYGSAFPHLKTVDEVITVMTKDWAERKSLLTSLIAGIDQTVARGLVDPKRVGITGLSDGVSTVEYALINSDRFAAASISTCCEDPATVMTYGGTAWADWNRSVRHYPLATEDGRAFWKPMSLALNADRIRAPILMQLADSEYLLGLETYTALREKGKPVEMYVYPQEYHTKEQPVHRLANYLRDVDWFAFWLKGQEDPDPAKQSQYERWRALRGQGAPAAASIPAGP